MLQSLQAELTVARQRKQALLEQADMQSAVLISKLMTGDKQPHTDLTAVHSAQPAPVQSKPAGAAKVGMTAKPLPLRSLSWGSKPRQSMSRPPQRRNTAEAATLHSALPPRPVKQQMSHPGTQQPMTPIPMQHDQHQQVQQDPHEQIHHSEQQQLQQQFQQPLQQVQQQPLQQADPPPKVEEWLSQQQDRSVQILSQINMAALRQQVLEEVMQAITVQGTAYGMPSAGASTVQDIADTVKQQVAEARLAALKEMDAAENKRLQSVQRRTSKEVLQQANQMVAKANQAAAEAAQRSEVEASHLRRELNALKKEKRELVQHCSVSDKELASLQVTQERLQQQLSSTKAACKASDNRQTDMQAQHEASTADLQAQLEAAKQQIAELEATHQQAISDHMATAAIVEKQEQGIQQQHALHAAFVHGQLVAAKQLQLEVATATEEAGQHMTAVAADTSKLQQAYCHSQAELKQEVQQLKAELQEWQQACSSSGQASGTAVLARLVEMQSEVEAKTGLQGLLDEHVQVKVQLAEATQQLHSLQQQLNDKASQGTSHSLDLFRLQNKVEGFQFDIGSLTSSLQSKGQECAALQQQCRDLQDQLHTVGADHIKEMTSHAMRKQQLEQEVQQRDAHIQQLQQQLQAAAQHAQRAQQQHELQVLRTYRAAAAKSAEHLQGLKDRYFHTVPVGPAANQGRKQGPGSVLKMQRRDIAAAYAEFQQVRGSIQSMPSMPATPSSSSKRGMWAEGGFTSIKQPLRQDSGQSPMVSELFLLPAASDPSAAHSFALRSINRAASSSPQRRGSPEQTFSPKQTLSHLASSHNRHDAAEHADSVPNSPQAGFSKQPHLSWLTLPQAEISNVSVETSAAGSDSNAAVPSDVHFGSTVADGQPPPNWQLPFLQQLVQFEACLLTALMGLLTQQPAKRHDENVSEESKPDPTRQQSWPKSASRETADDTTGEMVRAMSAQKKDLSRRLKAAENSNRQLRVELQHYRGLRSLPQMPHSADPHHSSTGGVRESWQEMAAVLDMLQDMSEATDSMPQNPDGSLRPASAQAPLSSPSQTFRCASAHTPALLKAAQSQSYASMPNTPVAAAWADSKQSVLIKGQHPLSARCKSASNHSRMGSAQKSGSREHPLSARGGKRQPANNREWQT